MIFIEKVYTKKEIIEAMHNVLKRYCSEINEINYSDDFKTGVMCSIEKMQVELDFPKENLLTDIGNK